MKKRAKALLGTYEAAVREARSQVRYIFILHNTTTAFKLHGALVYVYSVSFIHFSLLQLEEKRKLCATDKDMETLQKRINNITTAQDNLRL